VSIYFQEKTWPELEKDIAKGAVAIVPLGMVEEHGPHMAVGADTMIAEDVCRDIAEAFAKENNVPPVLVLPTFWAGYNMKIVHKWPGSLCLRASVLLEALKDICGSLAKMGIYRIVLVNGHGNHDGIMRQLVRDMADEYDVWMAAFDVTAFIGSIFPKIRKSPPGGACHACEYETSIMLHYGRPVDMSKATNEDLMKYSSKFVPADGFCGSKKVVWSTWCLQDSKHGVYGDPTESSKETGEQLVKETVTQAVEFLKEYCTQTTK
jgi:creatinine amidohydrolase